MKKVHIEKGEIVVTKEFDQMTADDISLFDLEDEVKKASKKKSRGKSIESIDLHLTPLTKGNKTYWARR